MEKIKKNIFNFYQFIFILSFLFSLINCQTYTHDSMKSSLTGTVGVGVFVLILALCISVLICIFGQSTSSPMLFILIGAILSLLVFIILICVPIEPERDNDDTSRNNKKNYYIIARYVYFIIMLLLFLGIVGPFIILWTTIIIPERVDSRAQKVYEEKLDEKYLSNLKEERKLMEENNNEENNNQDLSLNNQLPLPRTFNSNTGHSSGLPALRRRNMNENNPGVRRRRRNNNENNFNNSNQDNNNIINNQ